VEWNAGTLNLTNQHLAIGSGGLLGSFVTVDSNQVLGVPNHQIAVESLANLNVTGGGFQTGSVINEGRIFISASTNIDFDADNSEGGLTNNEDLVIVDSSLAGNVVNQGDFVVAGNLELADHLILGAGGTIDLLIEGSQPGEFAALAVGGDVDLGGDLDVSLTGGFALTEGDKFKIIDVLGTRSGVFNGLVDSGLVGSFGGIELYIDYDAGDGNDVELFTISDIDADVDNDNDIDGADFLALQRENPALIPDWTQQTGGSSPRAATFSNVPEPATWWLFIAGLVLSAVARRRELATPNRPAVSVPSSSLCLR
jgi:hypothetical protein